MAATLPLTGDGDINQNDGTPADGKYKLTNSSSGAGKHLTIEGSDAATSSNADGGDIILQPGALDGTGANGNVGIGGIQAERGWGGARAAFDRREAALCSESGTYDGGRRRPCVPNRDHKAACVPQGEQIPGAGEGLRRARTQ